MNLWLSVMSSVWFYSPENEIYVLIGCPINHEEQCKFLLFCQTVSKMEDIPIFHNF